MCKAAWLPRLKLDRKVERLRPETTKELKGCIGLPMKKKWHALKRPWIQEIQGWQLGYMVRRWRQKNTQRHLHGLHSALYTPHPALCALSSAQYSTVCTVHSALALWGFWGIARAKGEKVPCVQATTTCNQLNFNPDQSMGHCK